MEKMKAYVFKDVGNLVYEERPIPHVKDPDDVLLKVHAVGICGSDLKIIEGKHHFRPNTILGHEFCGEVIEVGTTSTMSGSATGWRSIITSAAVSARSAAWG